MTLLLLCFVSTTNVLQAQVCPGDPVPGSQMDLRGNDEYKDGECPANDVQIMGARLVIPGDACNSCTPGTTVTAQLIIKLTHNTNSQNRYLGVFADLTETTMGGSSSTCSIVRCSGPLAQQSTFELNFGTITFTCGSELVLDDILLVWTAANGDCPVTPANNPNGKYCYNNPAIVITPPLNAVITADCGTGNTSDINLTVTGGSGSFSYNWSNGAITKDLNDVPLGSYTCTVTDNINKDSGGFPCQVIQSVNFTGPCCELFVSCSPKTANISCLSPLPEAADTEAEFEAIFGANAITGFPCGPLSITYSDSGTLDYCANGSQIVRTYTVTDGVTTETCTQTFTILYTPPTIPDDDAADVQCISATITPDPPTVYDFCGEEIIPSGPIIANNHNGCEGNRTFTYTYTNCAGASEDWVFTYNIMLTTGPDAGQDGSMTVACLDDATEPNPPTVYDYCGNLINPSGPSVTDSPNPLTCEGTRTYTWTYVDCAGNSDQWKYVYTIEYEPFTISTPPGSQTVACLDDITEPVPPAVKDNCEKIINPSGPFVTEEPNPLNCVGTRTYTWRYEDCTGYMLTWDYTYTVAYEDFEIGVADGAETVACIAQATEPVPPVVMDNCEKIINPSGPVVTDEPNPLECIGTRTYTWTYMDCAGNTHDWKFVYTIDIGENMSPDAGPDDGTTIECIDSAIEPNPPVVNDFCGTPISPTGPSVGGTYDGCEGTRTYTWTYTDCAGNSDQWTYTYTIDLTTGPDAGPDDGSTVQCIASATVPTPPSVDDYCGNSILPIGPSIGGTYDGCEGTRTFTWTYTDCAGNTDEWIYTYTIDLTTGPDAGPDDGSTVQCIAAATAPTPPSVDDYCGNSIQPIGPSIGGTYDGCEGTRTYTWIYTDCAGNTDEWIYTYTIDLTTGPDAGADDGSTVECIDQATEPTPPSVTDFCGNPIYPSGPSVGGTYVDCEGTRTYTWTYTDCAGNTDMWTYTYLIEYEDFEIGVADGEETVTCLSQITEPIPPAVTDNCDNLLSPSGPVVTDVPNPLSCIGTRTYTWTYTDCEGNSHDWKFVYTVEIDAAMGPDAGPDDGSTVQCIAAATEPTPPVVNDACGNPLSPSGPSVGGTYDGCEGTRTFTWIYTDCAGNTDDWIYTYTIDLTTGPDAGPDDGSTVQCIASATVPTPPSVDDYCGNSILPVGPSIGGTYDGCEGTRTFTWTYTDCAGNSDEWIYTYTIDLTTGPDAGPDDGSTVQCIAAATAPTPPSVDDYCGNSIQPVGPSIGGTYDGCEGTRTFTWTYTDCAGNSDEWIYTYTIDLTTGPDAGPDDGSTVQCIASATVPTPPSVDDYCGNSIQPVGPSIGGTYDGCEGTRTFTWTYTDCAGNTDEWIYTYTIDLTIGPDAGPDDGSTVQCIAAATAPTPPSVDDYCGNAILPVGPSIGGTYDGCEGTRTFTWTYTDCAGNSDEWIYTYTIDLTTGPDAGDDDRSTVQCIAAATPPTPPSVTDFCDNPIVPVGPSVGGTYNGCEGTRTFTWIYTDCAGNSDQWTYTYNIDLSTRPDAGDDDGSTVQCIAAATPPTPPSVDDFCGNTIIPSGPDTGGTYDGCEGTRTYTWTYTDCAGNSDQWTYTYNIDLTTGPDAGDDEGSTVQCIAAATTPTPPSVIDFCGNPIVPVGPSVGGTYNGCEGTRTFTWVYTDCAGNMDEWVYTYNIDLATGPDAGADDGTTIECIEDIYEPTPPSVNDFCGNPIIPAGPSISDSGSPIHCGGTRTYTWVYTDCAGNTDEWSFVFTIDDTTPPLITDAVNKTVECGPGNDAELQAWLDDNGGADGTDNCGSFEWDYEIVEMTSGCGNTGQWVVEFTATDDCGNPSSTTATFTIEDTTPPELTGVPEGIPNINCNDPLPPLEAVTASDICSGDIPVMATVDPYTVDVCNGYSITYRWKATDDCGLMTEASRTFQVLPDTEAPVITPLFADIQDGDTMYEQCNNADPNWDPFQLGVNDVEVTDNCSNVTVTFEDILIEEGVCGVSDFLSKWKCVYTAVDDCGNKSTLTFYMVIYDDIPPVFTYFPKDKTIDCDEYPTLEEPIATDACSGVTLELIESKPEKGECNYTITRTWIARDGCGNATTKTQTIYVEDNEAPVILPDHPLIMNLEDGDEVEVDCDQWGTLMTELDEFSIGKIDNCDRTPKVDYMFMTVNNAANCAFAGYTVRVRSMWTATDNCGNSSTFEVIWRLVDNTPPVISGVPADACVTEIPPVPDVTFVDACSYATMSFEQSDPIACEDGSGTYILRTWTAEDQCGNVSTASQKLILDDGTGPQISVDYPGFEDVADGGEAIVEAVCTEGYEYALPDLSEFVQTTDNCMAGEVTTTLSLLEEGNCAEDGYLYLLELRVEASDLCGNISTYTVSVKVVDNEAPVISGPIEATINCSDELPDLVAEDACTEVVSLTVEGLNEVTEFCGTQSLERLWTATDACGNVSTMLQILTIVDDEGPELIGLPDDVCDVIPEIPVVTAVDACTGEAAEVSFEEVTEAGPCGDIIRRTWSATDGCGNTSTHTQSIYFNDTEPPVIGFKDPVLRRSAEGRLRLACVDYPEYPAVMPTFGPDALEVSDACTGDVDVSLDIELISLGDCATDGYLSKHLYTWTATDPCGNSAQIALEITFIDNYAPVLVGVPHDLKLDCDDEIPHPATVTAIDDCSEATVSMEESIEYFAGGYTILRTWTSEDACGNSRSETQKIKVYQSEISGTFSSTAKIDCGSDDNMLSIAVAGGEEPYTYFWEMVDCDGFITSGQGTKTIKYTAGYTTLNFRVKVVDAGGCLAIFETSIECIKEEVPDKVEIVNVFGRNLLSGNQNDPTEERVTLDLTEYRGMNGSFLIVDTDNRPVRSFNYHPVPNDPVDFDLEGLAPGVYRLEMRDQPINIFPNPTATNAMIDLSTFSGASGTLIIYDMHGKKAKVMEIDEVTNDLIELKLEHFDAGLYQVSFRSNNGQMVSHKLIIQRP